MKIFTQIGFACSLAFIAPALQAATPLFALNAIQYGASGTGGEFSLGFRFSLNGNYSVSSLGLLDYGSNTWSQSGFEATHLVSLLDSGNNVLAQVTFSPISAGTIGPGTPDGSNSQFRYLSITPLTLTAGVYTFTATYPTPTNLSVVGLFNNDFYLYRPLSELTSTTASNFASSVSYPGGTGAFFGSGQTLDAYIFANALLDPVSVSAVPEPSEFAMMIIGLGVIGAMARRRRSQSA
jgi:PEP-CTERM motif